MSLNLLVRPKYSANYHINRFRYLENIWKLYINVCPPLEKILSKEKRRILLTFVMYPEFAKNTLQFEPRYLKNCQNIPGASELVLLLLNDYFLQRKTFWIELVTWNSKKKTTKEFQKKVENKKECCFFHHLQSVLCLFWLFFDKQHKIQNFLNDVNLGIQKCEVDKKKTTFKNFELFFSFFLKKRFLHIATYIWREIKKNVYQTILKKKI